jgi:predicted TIM-barrel fold metal-dependent hydrolase
MSRDYKVISTDDHLQEGPNTWLDRMSKEKWGNRIPQLRRNAEGQDNWFINDAPHLFPGVGSVRGIMPPGKPPLRWEDVPKKAWVPAERVKAMVEDGVDVHTFFGNITGVAGNTFSNPDYPEDLRLACIQAYNDYQIDEFADPYPGRFITLVDLPMWDVNVAVAELHRMVKRGVKGASFAFPEQYGYPSVADPYWYPLWAAAQEAEMSINFHVGSGASMGLKKMPKFGVKGSLIDVAVVSVLAISANVEVMTTILFSGILTKFPKLKVVSSESGVGWVPYLLKLADHQWEAQALAKNGMPERPSDLFRRQCYVNFWYEDVTPEIRDFIGIDSLMWESDFPHGTGTYPKSREYIATSMKGWSAAQMKQVLVDNARKLYHL